VNFPFYNCPGPAFIILDYTHFFHDTVKVKGNTHAIVAQYHEDWLAISMISCHNLNAFAENPYFLSTTN